MSSRLADPLAFARRYEDLTTSLSCLPNGKDTRNGTAQHEKRKTSDALFNPMRDPTVPLHAVPPLVAWHPPLPLIPETLNSPVQAQASRRLS